MKRIKIVFEVDRIECPRVQHLVEMAKVMLPASRCVSVAVDDEDFAKPASLVHDHCSLLMVDGDGDQIQMAKVTCEVKDEAPNVKKMDG
jgi:hypothetical protein